MKKPKTDRAKSRRSSLSCTSQTHYPLSQLSRFHLTQEQNQEHKSGMNQNLIHFGRNDTHGRLYSFRKADSTMYTDIQSKFVTNRPYRLI
jgi:hypothetical protein